MSILPLDWTKYPSDKLLNAYFLLCLKFFCWTFGLNRSIIHSLESFEHRFLNRNRSIHNMSAILSQLDRLENQSIFIIREAYSQFRNVAILWSIGKDSTCLLWLVRKAFFGKIPFPVLHIDTTHKFKEIYGKEAERVG